LLPALLALGVHALLFKVEMNISAPLPAAIRSAEVTIQLVNRPAQVKRPMPAKPLPSPGLESIEPLSPKVVPKPAPLPAKPILPQPDKTQPQPEEEPAAAEAPMAVRDTGAKSMDLSEPVISESPAPVDEGNPPQSDSKSQEAEVVSMSTPLYELNPPIEYPPLARRRNYQGTVLLDVLVGRDGTVRDLRLEKSSGYSVLDRSALAAVRTWRFEPARRGTIPIEMWVKVPVRFEMP
jgi:protein TonB